MNIIIEKAPKLNKKEVERLEYAKFAAEWRKTHSISNPPSFTSWKTFYKNNK